MQEAERGRRRCNLEHTAPHLVTPHGDKGCVAHTGIS
jgi:hypothetical protein